MEPAPLFECVLVILLNVTLIVSTKFLIFSFGNKCIYEIVIFVHSKTNRISQVLGGENQYYTLKNILRSNNLRGIDYSS